MKKKALSLFLAWAMCLTMLPAALADEAPETEPAAQTAEELESEPAVQAEPTMRESELLSDISNYGRATLYGNVALSGTLTINSDTTLDLNGYSISLNAEGAVIFVTNNATLTLNDSSWGDGTITHGYDSAKGHTYYGPGAKVEKGHFIMNSGTITGNVDGLGRDIGDNGAGGVVLFSNYNDSSYPTVSTFTMNGGAITDNSAIHPSCKAGGVFVYGACSRFEMNGGTISRNTCVNSASEYGLAGGVYVYDGDCILSGGTISDNSINDTSIDSPNAAGGVRAYMSIASKSFSISGAVKITGNTYNGEANNLLLGNRQYLPISGSNPLTRGADIGVSTYNKPTVGTDVTLVDSISNPGNYLQYLSSDNGEYDIVAENSKLLLRKYNHRHEDDGVGFAHELTSQDGVLYIDGKEQNTSSSWTNSYDLFDNSYYLGTDLELDSSLAMGTNTILCLNGHNITTTADKPTIKIQEYGTSYKGFSLYDCEPGGQYGTIAHTNGAKGYGIQSAESFNLYGGHFGECTPYQIGLENGATVNISKALTTDEIYVGPTGSLAAGEYTTLVKGVNGYTLTNDDLARFKSSYGFTPQIMNNTIIFVYGDAKHIHSVCADANCTDKTHKDEIWKPIDSEDALRGITEAGNYYLTTDITLNNSTWQPTVDVTLCLNGHNITADGDFDAITVGTSPIVTFTLTDCNETYGKITHSYSGSYTNSNTGNTVHYVYKGSGVSVANSTFNMYGGSIYGNWLSGVEPGHELTDSDYKGGGVSVGYSGTFNMYGGTITKNVAINVGSGGIGLGDTYASANLLGGSITGNYGEPYTSVAGGIFLKQGSLTVGGDVNITGNYKTESFPIGIEGLTEDREHNVYLYQNQTLCIDSSLNSSARIGVCAYQTPYELNPVQITTNDATNKNLNYLNIFSADDPENKGYVIIHKDNNLYISPHQHSWSYSAEGDTITAKCTNTTGCPLTDGVGGTYTLKTQDTKPTYDGTVKSLTDCVEKSDSTLPDATIVCKQNGTDVDFKNAGDYDISLKLGDVESAPKTYTIEKATLTANNFTFTPPTDLEYNEQAKEASVAFSNGADGTITPHYYDASGNPKPPINAGKYTVKIDVSGCTNFEDVKDLTDLTADSWTFTITPADLPSGDDLATGIRYTDTKEKFYPASSSFGFKKSGTLALNGSVTSDILASGYPKIENEDTLLVKLADNLTLNTPAQTVTIPLTFTASSGNYNPKDVTLTITLSEKNAQEPLEITSTGEMSYNDTLTLTAKGGSTDSAVEWNITAGGDYADIVNGVLIPKGVGEVTITATKPGDDQFSDIVATKTIIIKQATITITAKDQTAKVGDEKVPDLAGQYEITGLAKGESLKTLPTIAYAETPDLTKAGTVAIVVKDAEVPDGGNYNSEIVYKNGTLTISARPSSGGGGGSSSTPKYAVSVPSDTTGGAAKSNVSTAASGSTVTITVTPEDGYKLDSLTVTDSKGNDLKLTDKGNGKYSFTMPDGKVDIKPVFVKEAASEPADGLFRDVSANDYFYEPVKWAKENGITGGVSATLFAPHDGCTRAHTVTFLWRAAGSPEPQTTATFSDVVAGSYYAKAVSWAIENGITNGVGGGKFAPDAPCTRGQMAALLHRYQHTPKTEGGNPFSDVKSSDYYYDAIRWAYATGVTTGTSATTFSPAQPCTRAQLITFLYRLRNE